MAIENYANQLAESPVRDLIRYSLESPAKVLCRTQTKTVTYSEMLAIVGSVQRALVEREIGLGDFVAIESDDTVSHLSGILGVMAVGAVAVPLAVDSLESFKFVIGDCKPKLIIGRSTKTTVEIERADLWDLVESGRNSEIDLERVPDIEKLAMVYYTSGTSSGIRKGVIHGYRVLADTTKFIIDVTKIDSTIVEFLATPTDNVFWFGRCRCILNVGGTMILNEGSLNPIKIITSIKKFNCNAISGDTPIYMTFLQQMKKYVVEIGLALKWVKIASQAMPVEEKRQLLEIFPNARVVMGYGLTEAMRCCLFSWRDFPDALVTDGRPSPGVEIRIVGENGEILPESSVGEIQVRGVHLASGYLNKEELWQNRLVDGWYKTGDLGTLDKMGFLRVRARIEEVINVGGKTIASSEVEALIGKEMKNTIFAVCECKDPLGILGDVIALCVEGAWKEDIPWKEFRIKLFEILPQSFVPKTAYIVPAFPRTNNAKIMRTEIEKTIETGAYETL